VCCFSQAVEVVANTNIFARADDGRQFLVYSMHYAAAADLAMVLPLPIPPRSPEDAVRFVNLQRYPAFFDDIARGFPMPLTRATRSLGRSLSVEAPRLRVHDVGSFEASFVPRVEDFERLDERFRIPRQVWDRLPGYRDYGFAVFKLKGSRGGLAGRLRRALFGGGPGAPRRVHPMAFAFPRRDAGLLYFPTLHIHDRDVHSQAPFDHMLYCQPDPGLAAYLQGWEASQGPAAGFMDAARGEGIVRADQPCWRRPLRGQLENRDTLIGEGGRIPSAR
jgi:hypothetical protein